ncbi:MAG: hypothetical protein HQ543_00665, partial [Bacteroidetes bacterium]|nr:hypothetical protein [Bacteroidota bacterium]
MNYTKNPKRRNKNDIHIQHRLCASELEHNMSIYDNRDKPAYFNFDAPVSYCNNKHINAWWTEEHDKIIKTQIEKEHWNWAWTITDKIVNITPKEIIETWKITDPLCEKYVWYNVLMYFSIAKAKKLDYL